jgi:mercuric ion binding protein
MKALISFTVVAAGVIAGPAIAATKTVVLDVPSMYCEACPITVKKALSRVTGVSSVSVSFEKKEAVVTYDDAKADVGALTNATANAGFPSKPKP